MIFVFHCFDRIAIDRHRSGMTRRRTRCISSVEALGIRATTKEVLNRDTATIGGDSNRNLKITRGVVKSPALKITAPVNPLRTHDLFVDDMADTFPSPRRYDRVL